MFDQINCNTEESDIKISKVGKQTTDKVRPTRVELKDENLKKKLLINAKKLKDCGSYSKVYIKPELTYSQRKQNEGLRKELEERKKSGENLIIRQGKIVEIKAKSKNSHSASEQNSP